MTEGASSTHAAAEASEDAGDPTGWQASEDGFSVRPPPSADGEAPDPPEETALGAPPHESPEKAGPPSEALAAAPAQDDERGALSAAAREERGPAGGAAELQPPPFGASDPHTRAKRLARALVSDIVVYHTDRREQSLQRGTLRQDFREEIRKSWDEYVAQVGNEIARGTSYFRDALNDLLAGGDRLF